MRFIPTMNFNGQCREAMEMYREAFGGKVTGLLTYGEANDPAYTQTEEQKNGSIMENWPSGISGSS